MTTAILFALSLFAQAVPHPSPDPGRGPFSCVTYGARDGLSFDSTPGFESAIGAAARSVALAQGSNAEPNPVRVVRVPSGSYTLTRTLWLPAGVRLAGDGWASHLVIPNDARYGRIPAVVCGLSDPGCTATDRPDLFGTLDPAACPAPGARRGFSTAGGKILSALHNDLSLGRYASWDTGNHPDWWERTSVLTVDACLVRDPAKPWAAGVPLLGLGYSGEFTGPRPWALRTHPEQPGRLQFLWADDSLEAEAPGGRGISFAVPAGRVVRFSVMVDLSGRSCAWANGVQVATDGDVPAGSHFRANDDAPFVVGGEGYTVGWAGAATQPRFTLAGLQVTAGERWVVGKPGEPQRRPDGGTVDDAYRFFADRFSNPAAVGFLPLTDPVGSRTLAVINSNGSTGVAYVLAGTQGGGYGAAVTDLSIASPGPCVLLGPVLDGRVTGCRLVSYTGPALGAVPVGLPSYPIRVRECALSGDPAVEAFAWILSLENCNFGSWGRMAVKSRGVGGRFSDCFFGAASAPNTCLASWRPWGAGEATLSVSDFTVDSELGGFRDAVFEVHATPGLRTSARIERVTTARTGPGESLRPFLLLSGKPDAASDVTIDGVITSGCSALARPAYPGWTVTDASPLANVAPAPVRP